MQEVIQQLEQHKVYVEGYKTYMVPFSTVQTVLQESYNKNLTTALSSIEEELQKVEKELNNLKIDD